MRWFLMQLFRRSAWGITFLRLVLGGLIFYQGTIKVFLSGFGVGYLQQYGIPAPGLIGPILTVLEFGGGFLLIIGLFVRYLGLILTAEYFVLTFIIALQRGVMVARLEYVILAGVIILSMQGAGALAVDRVGRRWEPFFERRTR
jgi:putative oxidoreductase